MLRGVEYYCLVIVCSICLERDLAWRTVALRSDVETSLSWASVSFQLAAGLGKALRVAPRCCRCNLRRILCCVVNPFNS